MDADSRHNIRITIEYDGEGFQGWQRQAADNTIQGNLERVVTRVLGQPTTVTGAGRTDSGVHAQAQVANFFSPKKIPAEKWVSIFNTQLPPTIRVQAACIAPPHFHAQRSALSKLYCYRILNAPAASALDRQVHFYPRGLDWEAIRMALPYFVGTHDFKSFQGAKSSVLTTVRTLYSFELDKRAPHLYVLSVEGNGFLKQMVRAMVGTLLEIGEGKRKPEDVPRIIAARDRRAAGRTAPASGLKLVRVHYPGDEAL